jgi:UDP-glucuronate 4-epimerase
MNMIKASEIHGVEHFMYASSSSVYGDRENGPFKEDSKLSEPKSLYALSKLANEIIARDYPSNGMKRTGLRFFTVYGPWGRPDMAIFRVLTAAHLGKTFNLTADLSVLRDFTYVNDLCNSVHSLMLTHDLESNSIFNIAGGKPRPLADIFGFLKSIGAVVDLANVGSDPSDVKMTYGSVEKLADAGVYVPGTSLEDGLLETWNWLQSIDPVELAQWHDFSSN